MSKYPRTPPPVGCDEKSLQRVVELGADLSDENVAEICKILYIDFVLNKQVVQQSSPGAPWTKLGSSNQDVIENYGPLLKRVIVERFVALLSNDYRALDAETLFRYGLADPVKLFVKNEPHSQRKLAEGRLRLISSVSICWNTISRVLYGRQNRNEKHHWKDGVLPAMCGMGSSDDDLKTLSEMWESQGFDRLAEADVSGWDWSVQPWQMESDAERRIQLCNAGPLLSMAMRNTHHLMSNKVFMLSDGRMFSQIRPGVLPSGWYCTTTTNSYIRALAAHLVGARFYRVLGDDSVETFVDGAVEKYQQLGHDVKFYRRCENVVEFCSRRWSIGEWQAPLVTWPRTFYRLLCQKPSLDFRQQFMFEMRHNQETRMCVEVLMSVGWDRQIELVRQNAPQEEQVAAVEAEPSSAEGSVCERS